MKLLVNSSCGNPILDLSGHTVTKHLNGEKTQRVITSKILKRLNHITNQLYKVEQVNREIEHREPIIFRFFFLNFVKERMLEL